MEITTRKTLLSELEAAQFIGMSRSFLAKSRMVGNLDGQAEAPPWIKCGPRSIRYDVRDLEAWIEQRRCEPSAMEG